MRGFYPISEIEPEKGAGIPLWKAVFNLNKHGWENPNPPVMTGAAKVYGLTVVRVKPWKLFGFWKFSGYKGHKMSGLFRTYLPTERMDLIAEKIKRREPTAGRISGYSCIGQAMGTGKKDTPRKTGECIQGVSFELVPKRDSETGEQAVNVNVFFRVAEVTRRFLGDLVFIDTLISRVLEPCGLKDSLNTVTLCFASWYVIGYHLVLWERMFPGVMQRIDPNDRQKENRWKAYWYEGTSGRSNAPHHNPLTHSPKITAAATYKDLDGVKPLFRVVDGKIKLSKKHKRYDGPSHH